MLSRFFFRFLVSTIILLPLPALGQTVLTVDLVQWTEDTVDAMADEDTFGFSVPQAAEIADFEDAVALFLAEDWSAADTAAAAVDYEVVEIHDTGHGDEVLYALVPEAGNTAGRGFFLLRPRVQIDRHLLLEAPHPRNDQRTAVLASEIFRASGARALIFAGSHRCANTGQFSGCSGHTKACADTEQGFLESDMAHTEISFFHAFHLQAAVEEAETLTVQVHGFSSDSNDPEFTFSDGTDTDDANPLHLPNALAFELEARIADAVFPATPAKDGNSCNRPGDIDLSCGTVNVQGRFVNGSTSPCSSGVTAANGRFLHMELSSDLRHPGGTLEPQLVIDALLTVLPDIGAEVAGRVWADLDGNGLQDAGEPGLEGRSVALYEDLVQVAATVTGADGAYEFTRLAEGDYEVAVILPAGYTYSPRDAGADAVDSEVDPGTGRTAPFHLPAGGSLFGMDAGLEPLGLDAQVGDRVWHDEDGNGLQDAGEPGIGGIGVELLNGAGSVLATTSTASNGSFLFTGLLPGDYALRFLAPGWGATQQVLGSPALDSDLDPQTGETAVFSLGPDQVDLSRDAGFTADCLDVALVPYGSVWRTVGPSGTWTANWLQPAFDDASWATGQGPLGFPDDVNGVIGDTGVYAYYFRHAFEVSDAGLFQELALEIFRDDAAVVYLNGVEVLRSNLPAAPAVIGPNTRASGSSEATASATLPASLLVTGTNVLAVEVHQRSLSNGDLAFDLHLTATVCNPCRVHEEEFDQVRTTQIREDEPTRNFASRDTVWVDGDSGTQRTPLMAWQLGGIPSGAEVLHAEIEVLVDDDSSDFFPLYAVGREWTETQATWQLAKSGTAWAGAGATGAGDRAAEPVGLIALPDPGVGRIPLNAAGRDLVEGWLAGTVPNHGLVASHEGQGNGVEFASEEGLGSPVLRVIYLTPSCTP